MRVPTIAFAGWTLFVWLGRIRNAVAGDEGLGPVLLAASFVLLACAVLGTRGRREAVVALAGWTLAVWAVRAVDIALFSDHDAGFVVVHVVLAAVSVGLAAWAVRNAPPPPPRSRSSAPDPSPGDRVGADDPAR